MSIRSMQMREGSSAGAEPCGVELRLFWGSRLVEEQFLLPLALRRPQSPFKEGNFEIISFEAGEATVRFPSEVNAKLWRRAQRQCIKLQAALSRGLAIPDDGAVAVVLQQGDSVEIEQGSLTLVAANERAPKLVRRKWLEGVDYAALNILMGCVFLGALFAITAANSATRGEALSDEFLRSNARIVELVIRQPPPQIAAPSRPAPSTDTKKMDPPADEHPVSRHPVRMRDTRPAAEAAGQMVQRLFTGSAGISALLSADGAAGDFMQAADTLKRAGSAGIEGLGGSNSLRGSGLAGGGVSPVGHEGLASGRHGARHRELGAGHETALKKQPTAIELAVPEVLDVGSPLDRELIRRVIHDNRRQIRSCYEFQLTRSPTLGGKISLRFVITPEGSVASSTISESTAQNEALEACVAQRARTWVFPKPKGGGQVVVTYPFVFKASGQ